MLARVDGKSPVEYLDADPAHAVRAFARAQLESAPPRSTRSPIAGGSVSASLQTGTQPIIAQRAESLRQPIPPRASGCGSAALVV